MAGGLGTRQGWLYVTILSVGYMVSRGLAKSGKTPCMPPSAPGEDTRMEHPPRRRLPLLAQGTYYLGTGVAPFVSRRAFAAVTGPKREWWLVETVGVLVSAVGAGLVLAAARDRVTPELTLIATGCAGGLAAIDLVYVLRGRISPAYLADAAAQIALLAAHADASRGSRMTASPQA